MPNVSPINPVNLPQPIVRSVSSADRSKKVAYTSFPIASIVGAGTSLNKPYISFSNMTYGLGQLSLFNVDPYFGDIKSIGYTYRNGNVLGDDYADKNSIALIESLNPVIVYDNVTSSTVHIECDKIPLYDVASATNTGLWLPASVNIEGACPFFGMPQDQIEVCVIPGVGENGFLQLRIYNFDVSPFHKTTFSQFVNAG